MTLGGLALAVGILVDDATVTIENINYHLEQGEEVEEAILNGAHEIALPALVSTLAICIVFVPMFMLGGVARYLFIPLAEAVVFAMLASYLLSRTLVPTLAKYWLQQVTTRTPHDAAPRGFFQRLQHGFERWFDARARATTTRCSSVRWRRACASPPPFLGAMALTALLAFPFGRYLPGLGQDFFPAWMPGRSSCTCARSPAHASRRRPRCAIGSKRPSARSVPAREIATIVDNIGVPYSGINTAYSTSAPVGSGDADILVNLNENHHPTIEYVQRLRARLNRALSFDDLRFPASRYRQPDPELRTAGAPRRAGVRIQCRRQPHVRQRAAGAPAHRSRAWWTCASSRPSTTRR